MAIPIPIYILLATVVATVLLMLALFRIVIARKMSRFRELSEKAQEDERFALLGTVATGLAHEMRTPLSTLTVNLDLLKEEWKNPITDREQRGSKKLSMILNEARRLDNILKDFLRFASGQEMNLQNEDVNSLLREISESSFQQSRKNPVAIKKDFADNLPKVAVDKYLLMQAVANLVLNAQQAMPNGGTIAIRTMRVENDAAIEVADTGIGIAPEIIKRIFNVYFSTKPGGTGLGLPITKRIIEGHGGTIAVRSTPSVGSVFTIRLPVSSSSPHQSASKENA